MTNASGHMEAQRFSQQCRFAEATGNEQLDWEMQEMCESVAGQQLCKSCQKLSGCLGFSSIFCPFIFINLL